MISIYFGLPRSGKSTYIAKCAYDLSKRNIPVFCNVPVAGAFYVDESMLETFRFPAGSIILWDEAGIDFNNRSYKTMKKSTIEFFKLHGHHKISQIIVFSQSWDDVDITIRRLAVDVGYIRKIGSFSFIRYIDRFIFMDDREHQIRSGFRYVPLWHILFFRKPVSVFFRPFYYTLFDSYSLPDKLKVPMKPYTSPAHYSKIFLLYKYIKVGRKK